MSPEAPLKQTSTPSNRRPSKRASAVPWDPSVQLDGPNEKHADINHRFTSLETEPSSSQVDDLGDGKQLVEQRATDYDISTGVSRKSTQELVSGTGTGFTDKSDRRTSLNGTVPAVLHHDETSGTLVAEPFDVQNQEDNVPPKDPLGDEIRDAYDRTDGKEKEEFLPIDALETIICKDRVKKELAILGNLPSDQIERYTNEILEPTVNSTQNPTSRRKLFVILALIDELGTIVSFIEESLYDSHLPFELLKNKGGRRCICRKDENDQLIPIKSFETWSTHKLEAFDRQQWAVFVPIFHLFTEEDRTIRHYQLPRKTILPFIEDKEVADDGGQGGFADVWRVKIHPAHHNRHNSDKGGMSKSPNPSFAVKRLKVSNYEAFHKEKENLKRFRHRDHLHLIKLLGTYCWRDQYYLIFPWADKNLLEFWKQYNAPSTPQRNHQAVLWFSQQCLGLAEGLKMIHTLDKPHAEELKPQSSPASSMYGCHGDLKPENILWFKELQDSDSPYTGHLKISDFGLTRFNRSGSKSRVAVTNVGMSPTYRAPEYDVQITVAPSYDMWSFACVLMEFVEWFLLGWEAVDNFSKQRTSDDHSEIKEDVFFNIVSLRGGNDKLEQKGARAKQSVNDEFKKLNDNPHCSDYFMELLDFIETRLLRMGPNKRAKCDEIVNVFRGLNSKCKDESYCLKKLKQPPSRSRTDLSELSAFPLEFSPEMSKRLSRTSIPNHTGPCDNDTPSSSDDASVAKEAPVRQDVPNTEKDNLDHARPQSPGLHSFRRKYGSDGERSPSPSKRIRFSDPLPRIKENAQRVPMAPYFEDTEPLPAPPGRNPAEDKIQESFRGHEQDTGQFQSSDQEAFLESCPHPRQNLNIPKGEANDRHSSETPTLNNEAAHNNQNLTSVTRESGGTQHPGKQEEKVDEAQNEDRTAVVFVNSVKRLLRILFCIN